MAALYTIHNKQAKAAENNEAIAWFSTLQSEISLWANKKSSQSTRDFNYLQSTTAKIKKTVNDRE